MNSSSHKKAPLIHRAFENEAFKLQCLIQSQNKKKQKNPPQIFSAIMKQAGNSLGKECAAFDCSSRSYCFVNNESKSTGNSFFKFPKSKAEINYWCNLIKRQNSKDGFVVKENSTYICSKYFHAADIYRAPGGTRHSLINKDKSSKITVVDYF